MNERKQFNYLVYSCFNYLSLRPAVKIEIFPHISVQTCDIIFRMERVVKAHTKMQRGTTSYP